MRDQLKETDDFMARPEVKAFFKDGNTIKRIPTGLSGCDKNGSVFKNQSRTVAVRSQKFVHDCELMLEYVQANPGVTIGDLAGAFGVGKTKISKFITRFERRIKRVKIKVGKKYNTHFITEALMKNQAELYRLENLRDKYLRKRNEEKARGAVSLETIRRINAAESAIDLLRASGGGDAA